GELCEQLDRLVLGLQVESAESALPIGQRAPEDDLQVRRTERTQHEHTGATQQCADDLEGGVLSRRADERYGARLDVREEGVLLRLVEAVDLVAEQDRAPAARAQTRRCLADDLAHAC